MESHVRFFETNGGLRIAYEEYGDPAGEPVIFCHGWPSSRTQAALAHNAACEIGMRIISPDRPGIALSQFQPDRTLLDWPPLLAELTLALEIGRYRLLAISGGGPYALAAAWKNPEAVRAVAVVSGAIPLAGRNSNDGLFFAYAWLLGLHHRNPSMLRLLLRLARPVILMPVPDALKPLVLAFQQPADRKILSRDTDSCDICYKSTRDAWKMDALGATHDGELYARPWGFSPGEIRAPVRFWHGKEDRRFPWKEVEGMASAIPGCVTHFVENEGHNSLPISHMRQILSDLKNAG